MQESPNFNDEECYQSVAQNYSNLEREQEFQDQQSFREVKQK